LDPVDPLFDLSFAISFGVCVAVGAMATSYKTPKRGQGKENVHRQGGSGGKVKAVDVVSDGVRVE
jgi:hypothetical protein